MTRLWGQLFVWSARVHSRRLTRWLYIRFLHSKGKGYGPPDTTWPARAHEDVARVLAMAQANALETARRDSLENRANDSLADHREGREP